MTMRATRAAGDDKNRVLEGRRGLLDLSSPCFDLFAVATMAATVGRSYPMEEKRRAADEERESSPSAGTFGDWEERSVMEDEDLGNF
ncbi:unnamed protein product [Linum tenue]|uniref:Uncharacterized protein n=1 Tax=Linum tenue TaxID=586396 RepID=A0AAV0KKK6_9ROSI|nr:unnamed protein product [Linum tenue]